MKFTAHYPEAQLRKYRYYMGVPILSGSGGTAGYDILRRSNRLALLLAIKPRGKEQKDCYNIGHSVKILKRSRSMDRVVYVFDEESGKWEKC